MTQDLGTLGLSLKWLFLLFHSFTETPGFTGCLLVFKNQTGLAVWSTLTRNAKAECHLFPPFHKHVDKEHETAAVPTETAACDTRQKIFKCCGWEGKFPKAVLPFAHSAQLGSTWFKCFAYKCRYNSLKKYRKRSTWSNLIFQTVADLNSLVFFNAIYSNYSFWAMNFKPAFMLQLIKT